MLLFVRKKERLRRARPKGERSWLIVRLVVSALLRGFTAVAIGVQFKDGAVVNEAVDGGDGHGLVVEDAFPLGEGVVAGDDEAAPLIAMGDEFEKDAGFSL